MAGHRCVADLHRSDRPHGRRLALHRTGSLGLGRSLGGCGRLAGDRGWSDLLGEVHRIGCTIVGRRNWNCCIQDNPSRCR